MSAVLELSAVEQAALVRSGELSARELVEASLERIERLNPTVNAFVAVCAERALAEADAIAPAIPARCAACRSASRTCSRRPRAFRRRTEAPASATGSPTTTRAHVRRLREAGAIVVGKTNTPELGLRPVTENERFGPTRNPWNTRLSAGGSSGGSAAAAAAGMVGLADGSDLGGSIRIPASCCGLVGLKPSRGRVSIGPDYGAIGIGMPADGVLTRTVLDTATALDAIAGL